MHVVCRPVLRFGRTIPSGVRSRWPNSVPLCLSSANATQPSDMIHPDASCGSSLKTEPQSIIQVLEKRSGANCQALLLPGASIGTTLRKNSRAAAALLRAAGMPRRLMTFSKRPATNEHNAAGSTGCSADQRRRLISPLKLVGFALMPYADRSLG